MRVLKETKESIEELVKDKWLLANKKTKEIHYSLNSKKVKEIKFYEKFSKHNF